MSFPFVVKRAVAKMRWERLKKDCGEDALATRAAKGRVLFYDRQVVPPGPVEAIAWHRVAETRPGFMNRSQRKFYGR